MKRISAIVVLFLAFACVTSARPKTIALYAANVSTNSSASAITNTVPRSYLLSIEIDLLTSGTTCDVAIVTIPAWSTLTGTTLYSATNLTADVGPLYPRFDAHDNSGAASTSDPPWRYPFAGESIVLQVSNANETNKNVRALIKVEPSK